MLKSSCYAAFYACRNKLTAEQVSDLALDQKECFLLEKISRRKLLKTGEIIYLRNYRGFDAIKVRIVSHLGQLTRQNEINILKFIAKFKKYSILQFFMAKEHYFEHRKPNNQTFILE
jgi:hypothetical protein